MQFIKHFLVFNYKLLIIANLIIKLMIFKILETKISPKYFLSLLPSFLAYIFSISLESHKKHSYEVHREKNGSESD